MQHDLFTVGASQSIKTLENRRPAWPCTLLEAQAVGESTNHRDIKPQAILKCQHECCGSYFSASKHVKCDLLISRPGDVGQLARNTTEKEK